MSLIAGSDQERLREHFASALGGDVRVRLAVHPGKCSTCARAEAVLREITNLSPRLTLATEIGNGHLPEIRLEGAARGAVRYVGLPAGYEFPGLIDSIVDVSRGTTSLSSEVLTRLDHLGVPVHLQVFTTPT